MINHTPEALLRSVEKFYMDLTEPLDPYVALALTNLSLKMIETVYTMGYQDGQHHQVSCQLCKEGKCIFPG